MGWALPCDVFPEATVPRMGASGGWAERAVQRVSETASGEKDGAARSPAGRVGEGPAQGRESRGHERAGPEGGLPEGPQPPERRVTAGHSERGREHVPGLSDVTARGPRHFQ